jgi:hypothetical protein
MQEFVTQYFAEFIQQLQRRVKQRKPDVVSTKNAPGLAEKLEDTKVFKMFFDSEVFNGVEFRFPNGTDFAKAVETYNKDKGSKDELAWVPGTKKEYPAVYVLPDMWNEPKDHDASKAWLEDKKGTETITRLEKLKRGLKREAECISGKELEEVFLDAVDALTADDWQVVVGFEEEEALHIKSDEKAPKVLVKADRSLLFGDSSDFALRLCNGFPLSKEQREAVLKFVKWEDKFCSGEDCQFSINEIPPVIKAVLRFFLSYPDMELPEDACTDSGKHNVYISEKWKKSWNFTFGQLYEKYKNYIPWDDASFKAYKRTNEDIIDVNNYKAVVGKWAEKSDTFRKESEDCKKLEKRFKAFLESLRGFDDWGAKDGDMKRWETYQLERWKQYKDLSVKKEDLPESLPNKEAIDAYNKKKAEAEAAK